MLTAERCNFGLNALLGLNLEDMEALGKVPVKRRQESVRAEAKRPVGSVVTTEGS